MYHITMRVNHQHMQLRPIAVKELYIKVVRDAKRKFKFRIETFCILDNHVHFIIQPEIGENVSRIMQWINGVFAMRYNRLMGIGGSFWGERFYSRVLQRLKDYLRTLVYIEENPVRANLVRCAVDWLFGGARHRADKCYAILDSPG